MSDQAGEKRTLALPDPILDGREYAELDKLTEQYERLTSPGLIGTVAKKAAAVVPSGIKGAASHIGNSIAEQEIYEQALGLIGSGFKVLEEQVARFTVSEGGVIRSINAVSKAPDIGSIEEICLMRGYDVSKAANRKRFQNTSVAFVEGGATGALGVVGIPFNLALGTLAFYRAVQSTAMSYGYDVKNDPAELVIASEVFANALSPASKGGNGVSNNIAKFMAISAAEGVRQMARKTWAAMIERGGPALLLAQMRALANAAARKALESAGKTGLEKSMFKELFVQIGRRLTLKTIQRVVPIVSAGIGALTDTAQMNTVIRYADLFYHKRFLIEKEDRVRLLLGVGPEAGETAATTGDLSQAEAGIRPSDPIAS